MRSRRASRGRAADLARPLRGVVLPRSCSRRCSPATGCPARRLELLKPRRWDDLLSGLGRRAAGARDRPAAVRSADPWPRIVLELLGSRAADPRRAADVLAAGGDRRQSVAGAAGDAGARLPVRGAGRADRRHRVAGDLARRRALGACSGWRSRRCRSASCGSSGCRCGPGSAWPGCWSSRWWARCRWRRRRTAASRGSTTARSPRSLGPDDPVRFSWTQSYGPIDWPREGNEVMRVVSGEPLYWKARNLDDFNGIAWQIAQQAPQTSQFDKRFEADLPEDWENRPAWTETVEFNIKRMRTTDVIGAGTTVDDQGPVAQRPRRPVARHLGRAERAAPQRLLHGRGPRPAAGHRPDVGGDHRRGRAPGRRARA